MIILITNIFVLDVNLTHDIRRSSQGHYPLDKKPRITIAFSDFDLYIIIMINRTAVHRPLPIPIRLKPPF